MQMICKKFQDRVVSLVVFAFDAVTGTIRDALKWVVMPFSGLRETLLLL